MKKLFLASILSALITAPAMAADSYVIDTKGAHASIKFEISHLGYSWVAGRFNDFSGSFDYDSELNKASNVNVKIDVASVDSNHAERDKHLKSSDFLNAKKYPKSTFVSTGYKPSDNGNFILMGDFTFNGVTKPIEIDVEKIGEGKDPWGGYRVGFRGNTQLKLSDYNIKKDLGPASTHVNLILDVEGIKK